MARYPETIAYGAALVAEGAPPVAAPADFGRLLGLPSRGPLATARALEKGLPYDALARFQKATGWSAVALSELLLIPARTLLRRRDEGHLTFEESDRLARAARTFARALALFEGDAAAARLWLEQKQAALGGERPVDLARSDVGAREVEALIERLEHGVLA
jgi:putative toxin-antitoxin system antitoxin component (TIGR02293 family)